MRISGWVLTFLFSSGTFADSRSLLDKRSWDRISDPLIMLATSQRNYNQLPMKGKFGDPMKLWSGDYWPLKKGNINFRWNAKYKTGFNLDSPDKETALEMTETEIAQLAPSEKFDLLMGNYDYPLVAWVDENAANRYAGVWEGICHGWSPAALNHNEPTPKTLINPDGIKVPFGSSDIKALISHYYAKVHKVESTHQTGLRCGASGPQNRDTCIHDMNAGAFHIILTNQVGLNKNSFVTDIERNPEVWNHSVASYQSWEYWEDWPAPNSAPGTWKRMKVETEVQFLNEQIGWTSWNPVIGTNKQAYVTKTYLYYLDLDNKNNIIGGEWESFERPDFLWTMAKAETFREDFARLPELLND